MYVTGEAIKSRGAIHLQGGTKESVYVTGRHLRVGVCYREVLKSKGMLQRRYIRVEVRYREVPKSRSTLQGRYLRVEVRYREALKSRGMLQGGT